MAAKENAENEPQKYKKHKRREGMKVSSFLSSHDHSHLPFCASVFFVASQMIVFLCGLCVSSRQILTAS
jgi:hypothetical protein